MLRHVRLMVLWHVSLLYRFQVSSSKAQEQECVKSSANEDKLVIGDQQDQTDKKWSEWAHLPTRFRLRITTGQDKATSAFFNVCSYASWRWHVGIEYYQGHYCSWSDTGAS